MIRRPPRSTQSRSSAASDVYKRQIPVSPDTVSVGYVAPGAALKAQREEGMSVEDVFREQLTKFPRFEPLLQQRALDAVNVTSFRCRVYLESAGPNWLIAGEAASLV